MFETAEIGNKIDKDTYIRESIKVRDALLTSQRKLLDSNFPLIIIVSGNEGAGKSELVNLLNEWMDARGIQTHAMWNPSDEERERPPLWRFWRALPPKGRIGIFFGSWYTGPVIDRVYKRIDNEEFERCVERVQQFERLLVNEGALIQKFWLHLSKPAQKQRLKELEKNPDTKWRVSELDWKFYKKYEKFRKFSEIVVRETSTAEAPWHIVEATDKKYVHLTVTKQLLSSLSTRLAEAKHKSPAKASKPAMPKPTRPNVVTKLDLKKSLSEK